MGGAAEQKIPTTELYVGQLTEDFLRARLSHNLHFTKKGYKCVACNIIQHMLLGKKNENRAKKGLEWTRCATIAKRTLQ